MAHERTSTGPVNIAVIKYWGKRDTELILPTNSSISITLSQDQLRSKTTIRASPKFTKTRLWLNGVEEHNLDNNIRLQNCLRATKKLRKEYEDQLSDEIGIDNVQPISSYNLHICSENNFPTAAGLASSASGFACLVYTLSQLYELPISTTELSKIARQGSGSACRSLFGGFVNWQMGIKQDGSDSQALQIAPHDHWPELAALICIVSDAKKGTSSTEGMQNTVKTSTLLQYRINNVVPERMKSMTNAILHKNFNKFAEITMKDSNQFHACCLDTFPPIFYLNDVSRSIIRVITEYNNTTGRPDEFKAAYTFDAGPNAVIYALKQNIPEIINIISKYFPPSKNNVSYFSDPYNLFPNEKENIGKLSLPNNFNENIIPVFPDDSVKQILHTRIGNGPRINHDSLLNPNGYPKNLKS
ncbi:diphosphomevalonate decarboxylase [Rhizophagus irregularis]|uniref:Diphosphomevalonate decarboxylase n=3 Tax=Rhizophagus irregularis TaxID=588596 RepID=A0A2I1FTD8_9GLOM|nr:diphosphomevalonate decarboxylase [Rhizophagus irregularis DAOM 181602=DAOM 197198]EXX73761.1 diphosphomevalonate decarboxylase MVD1 [Rhizophagus irregularis DAOM 197198w]PKC17002.1 diphosphomevalonate decarboxylase [Rhizophagus irregularis]PKC69208.1 diphosphomevalonate decarboxylase [Rhizophagus irregularis]PKK77147.1 diphosphomevalonate decarboxylase [Rhizophagus irregularis]PKY18563.1 diphosphomevalonate decarboxylase [Rhizophagus irregularis]|eukprot:XP_025182350.1 diphosphomevalonate decarboxylase [Rhizophagus irregularis DAOM 181602=DAOM 197198]